MWKAIMADIVVSTDDLSMVLSYTEEHYSRFFPFLKYDFFIANGNDNMNHALWIISIV